MDTLYIAIVVVGIIGVVFAVLQFKKQGKITGELIETVDSGTDKIVSIAKSFLEIIDLNPQIERSIVNILDISESVVDFAISLIDSNDDKTQISVEVVKEVLGKIGIQPNERELKMIQIITEESVKQIEKNQK